MSQMEFIKSLAGAVYRDNCYRKDAYQQLQQRKLKRLMKWSWDHVEFQRERLAGLDLDSPDLRRVEPTDKSEMMRRFDDTIADRVISWADVEEVEQSADQLPVIRNKYLVSRTSGTNGQTGCFVHDLAAWNRLRAISLTRTMRGRLSPLNLARFSFGRRCRMAFLITDCRYSTSRHAGFSPMRLGRLYADIRLFPVGTPVPELIDALNKFQPHYVHSYPTVFEAVAERHLREKTATFFPELISFSSESLLPGAAETIRAAFPNAIQRSIYATTECLPIGHGCETGDLHWNTDACLLEPVNRDGTSTPVGEFSDHVLITNLENYCQPLIRYRLDDSVRILPTPCSCGRSLPVIEVQGRTDDQFHFVSETGEDVIVPPVPITLPLHKVDGLMQFQLIQNSRDSLDAMCVIRPDTEFESLKQRVKSAVYSCLDVYGRFPQLAVAVKAVDSIERVGNGQKLRQCISHVSKPSGAPETTSLSGF